MIRTRESKTGYVRQIAIRTIGAAEVSSVIRDLVHVFKDTVNSGSPLGFMPPITLETARDYWLSNLPQIEAGSRILLVATYEGSVVGSAQLELSQRSNSPHRADVQRVFVARALRGQGVGTALMEAIEDAARTHGRTLLTLNTRNNEPAHVWYKSLGYADVGVIPGWTIGAHGERYDHVTMYKKLGQ
jgi:GNAT superfamily N-acetyltransferase